MRRPLRLVLSALTIVSLGCGAAPSTTKVPPDSSLRKEIANTNASPSSAFAFMVVGTAHRGHLQIADYPLSKLDALLAGFRPDLVLVEIRPQPFAEGHLEDGPLEMSYVTTHARSLGISVEPIDWFLDSMPKDAPDDPAAEQALQKEVGDLPREVDSFAPFAVLNGPKRAHDFLKVENAGARYGIAESVAWHRRQAWFHAQAIAAIEKHHAQRVAAFVGFAHRPELDVWLSAQGGASTSPLSIDTATVQGTPVGDDLLRMWRDSVARLRQKAATAEPPIRKRLEAKIRYWEIAIERRGLCCVDDRAFVVP